MSEEKYCKVYIPLKFLLFNLIVDIFIISLGFIFNTINFSYEFNSFIIGCYVLDNVSIIITYYGFYSVIVSILVFSINILIQIRNTKNKNYIFILSILPMSLMCITHILMSIFLFDCFFSLLLLLPCIFVIATIIFERGTFVC